ncbi:oligosaccharide flippase family protein [Microterricola viridarii]|uniref:Uncharacterized protein n=1 Tax=Microterricola viridarii TaxID=412690 RepID=A0A0X8E332_9MICO|nr:oligosaccharide flippase family protein [Microterricola viridarii]AMB59581.1 hypothetical protein AWU67_12685 [Microterricola viridarii]
MSGALKRVGGTSRSVAIATLGNLGAPLAAFISAPILARVLGVDDRGEVAAITAPFLLAVSALTIGLPEAITYFASKRPASARRVLRQGTLMLAAVGLLGSLALLWLMPLLIPGVDGVTSACVALALIPSLVLGGVRGYAAGLGAWKQISIERTFGALARLAAVVALAWLDVLTIESASLAIAVTTFAGGICYIPLLLSRRSPRDAPDELGEIAPRNLLSFGSRLWFGSLAGVLLSRLDQTLMIPLSSPHQLGLYAVAVSVSEVTLVFNSAVRDVIFAAESGGTNEARLTLAARASTMLTFVMCAAVGILSTWWLAPVFGEEFAPAIAIVHVLLIGVVLGNPGSVAGAGLSARGRPELRSYALVVACIVNVGLVVLLVPTLGAMGAAIATVAGNTAAGGMCIFWMRRVFGVPVLEFLGVRWSDVVELTALARRLVR